MGQRFTHGGVEYEELGNSKVRVIGAAPAAASAPYTVTPLPLSPEQQAEEDRKREDQQFQRNADARAAAAAARDAVKWAKENAETQTPGDTTKSGDDYLATLPAPLAGQVKALAEGRRAFPTGSALRSPQVQELVAAATQYDPTLDAANAATRVATRKDFTSGKAAQNITAMNTALGHLGSLSNAAAKLENRSFPLWNTVANMAEQATGDPRVKNFTLARNAVSNELMKVFRGTGGSVSEIEEWQNNIDSSDSPEQLHATITQATDLLRSRLEAMNDQYGRGMGKSGDPIQLLSPHAQQIYNKITTSPGLGIGDDKTPPAYSAGATGGGPQNGGGGTGSSPPPPPVGSPDSSLRAAPSGSTQASTPIPQAMQEEYAQWMGQNSRDLDPARYADFRASLDEKYGFPVTLDQHTKYKQWATENRDVAARGGVSFQLPSPNRQLSDWEQFRNNAVNNPAGAFVANMGNAGGFGIPDVLAGGKLEALREANPVSSTLGEMAGGITGTLTAGAGLSAASRAVSNPVARALLSSPLAADMAYGGVYGATQADDPLYGAVTGAGGALVGNMVGRQVGKLVPRLFGRVPADPLNRGERAVLNAAERTGIDPVVAALSQSSDLGIPATLADASMDINSLTGAAIRRSPQAASLARDTLGARSRGQYDRFVGAVERDLGPVTNIPQRSEDLIAQARTAAGPLYDAAYAAPGAGAIHPQIETYLNRPSMRGALARARTIAAEEGRDPNSLGFTLDAEGNTILTQVPSWQTLDYAKRGIDDVLEGYRDGTTGRLNLDEHGRAIDATRRQFLATIDTANPDYAAARATYAGPATERDALRTGQQALSMSPDQLGVNFNRATPVQQAQMRLGAQSQLVENAGRLRQSTNPFESTLGTPAMEQRLGTLYGNDGDANIARLLLQRDTERELAASTNRLIGNSMTAERNVADDAFGAGGELGDAALEIGANIALGQVPIGTAIRGLLSNGLRDQLKLGVGRRGRDLADEIAPLALDTDTQGAVARLLSMQQRSQARDAILDSLMQTAALRGGHIGAGTGSAVAAALMR
jgi:hypothetical protein